VKVGLPDKERSKNGAELYIDVLVGGNTSRTKESYTKGVACVIDSVYGVRGCVLVSAVCAPQR
ncbi:hypothetical protein BaRGS_00027608, partial [Batillaria attramentaria]